MFSVRNFLILMLLLVSISCQWLLPLPSAAVTETVQSKDGSVKAHIEAKDKVGTIEMEGGMWTRFVMYYTNMSYCNELVPLDKVIVNGKTTSGDGSFSITKNSKGKMVADFNQQEYPEGSVFLIYAESPTDRMTVSVGNCPDYLVIREMYNRPFPISETIIDISQENIAVQSEWRRIEANGKLIEFNLNGLNNNAALKVNSDNSLNVSYPNATTIKVIPDGKIHRILLPEETELFVISESSGWYGVQPQILYQEYNQDTFAQMEFGMPADCSKDRGADNYTLVVVNLNSDRKSVIIIGVNESAVLQLGGPWLEDDVNKYSQETIPIGQAMILTAQDNKKLKISNCGIDDLRAVPIQ